jgi:RHS repeat-associated protein
VTPLPSPNTTPPEASTLTPKPSTPPARTTGQTPTAQTGVSSTYTFDNVGAVNAIVAASDSVTDSFGIDQAGPSDDTWLTTNQAGDQTGFWGYDAYGGLAFGTPTSPFGYSGQYTDPTTGLVNDRARWYQPQTGDFTARDPAFGTTDTAYTYADGDPVNDGDPIGQRSTWKAVLAPEVCLASSLLSLAKSAVLSSVEGRVRQAVAQVQAASAQLQSAANDGCSPALHLAHPSGTLIAASLAGIFLRQPDYYAVEIAGGDYGAVGGVVITFDRYGEVFLGPEGGAGIPGVAGTIDAGWIDQSRSPDSTQLHSFLGGWSVEGSVYLDGVEANRILRWLGLPVDVKIPILSDVSGPAIAEVWGNVFSGGWSSFSTQVGIGFGAGKNAAITPSYSFHISNSGPQWTLK